MPWIIRTGGNCRSGGRDETGSRDGTRSMQRIRKIFSRSGRRTGASLRRFRAEVAGVAAIEFAFLAPLMLLMYVGTIEVSAAVTVNRKLSRVASTIGDLITQQNADNVNNCIAESDITDIISIADDILFPYTNPMAIVVSNVQVKAGGPEVVWSRANSLGTALSAGDGYVVPDKIKTTGIYLLATKVTMGYSPSFGWVNLDSKRHVSVSDEPINMEEEIFLRARLDDQVTICS